jgi:hypothetical protein
MARTQISTDLLRQFAQLLGNERANFEQIKSSMDTALQSFLWDDPVAIKFKNDYQEQLKPLKAKLLPAMIKYEDYLKSLSGLGDVYTENSSPSLSASKIAAAGAGVVGVAGVGAMLYRGKDYSKVFKGVDLSAKHWIDKTQQQKLDELQKLENNIAKVQNRSAATVKAISFDNPNTMGTYNANTLYINEKLLEGNDYDKLKDVVKTVAHEGRHDCQYEASMIPESSAVCGTEKERKLWKTEFSDMKGQYAIPPIKTKEGKEITKTLIKCNWEYKKNGEIDWEKSVKNIFDPEKHKSGSVCDYDDYRHGNQIEVDAVNFEEWVGKQFWKSQKPKRWKP